jgi:hypothetical protein
MRFEEFVAAYPREYTTTHRPARPAPEFATFEGFQRAYSLLVHDLLEGRARPEIAAAFERVEAEWRAWGAARLDQLVRDLWPRAGSDDVFDGPGMLVFGQLTFAMRESWRHAFAGDRLTGVEVRRMQLFLAGFAVHLHNARDWAAAHQPDAPQEAARLAFHSGMLTELDTALLLLELSKTHRWLTVLPAPAAFEQAAGRANADLLLLDLERREVLGVQVKTTVRDRAVFDRYRTERVVLVDGWTDLGNTRLVDIARRSDKRLVSWPGLISAHYLAGRSDKSQDFLRAPNAEWLTEKRAEARRLTVGTTDYRQRALSAVRDRILDRFSRTARP